MPAYPALGLAAIRIGMAGVILWFGVSQVLDPAAWTGFVPGWADALGMPLTMLVLANGMFEVFFGALLLAGVFTRITALVLAVHVATVAMTLGYNAVAIRDWGLAAALLGVALCMPDRYTIDNWRASRATPDLVQTQ